MSISDAPDSVGGDIRARPHANCTLIQTYKFGPESFLILYPVCFYRRLSYFEFSIALNWVTNNDCLYGVIIQILVAYLEALAHERVDDGIHEAVCHRYPVTGKVGPHEGVVLG